MSSFRVIIKSLEFDVELWTSNINLVHDQLKVSNSVTVEPTAQDDPSEGNNSLRISGGTNISITDSGESLKCPIDSDNVFHAIRIIFEPLPYYPEILVGLGRVCWLQEFSEPVPQASYEMVQENNDEHHSH
jgi:hypothetical protein